MSFRSKNTDIFFYRMMDDYCRGKERVCVLNVKDEPTYYSYGEFMIGPRVVTARFYMPRNMELRLAGSISELEREARRLRRTCPTCLSCPATSACPSTLRCRWRKSPGILIRSGLSAISISTTGSALVSGVKTSTKSARRPAKNNLFYIRGRFAAGGGVRVAGLTVFELVAWRRAV